MGAICACTVLKSRAPTMCLFRETVASTWPPNLSPARVMGPRLARTMGPGDGHRGPADQMPQIAAGGEHGGPRQRADVRSDQLRRGGIRRRGCTGTFFTGAEGGGPMASMFGLSRDR